MISLHASFRFYCLGASCKKCQNRVGIDFLVHSSFNSTSMKSFFYVPAFTFSPVLEFFTILTPRFSRGRGTDTTRLATRAAAAAALWVVEAHVRKFWRTQRDGKKPKLQPCMFSCRIASSEQSSSSSSSDGILSFQLRLLFQPSGHDRDTPLAFVRAAVGIVMPGWRSRNLDNSAEVLYSC